MTETCRGPAYKGSNFRELWRRARDRCGQPATQHTAIYGPTCDACAARLVRASRSPNTLLGILRGVKPNGDDDKH